MVLVILHASVFGELSKTSVPAVPGRVSPGRGSPLAVVIGAKSDAKPRPESLWQCTDGRVAATR